MGFSDERQVYMNETIVYLYRVPVDSGTAPCAYTIQGGHLAPSELLTLACCKGGSYGARKRPHQTGMRHEIGRDYKDKLDTVDLWLCGAYTPKKGKPKKGKHETKLLYLAKVNEIMTMEDYYADSQYSARSDYVYSVIPPADRKLDPSANYCFYLKRNRRNQYFHNTVCPKGEQPLEDAQRLWIKDQLGTYVLLSREFVYLGKKSETCSIHLSSFPDVLDHMPDKQGYQPWAPGEEPNDFSALKDALFSTYVKPGEKYFTAPAPRELLIEGKCGSGGCQL